MSVVINTNSAATIASNNLSASTAMLQRSLARLSSGSKIVNASDDAGGVAVASRLGAAVKRSGVAAANIGNAVSFLQTQDSSLKTMSKILERMSELQTLNSDTTKSSTDLANYGTEFTALKTQFNSIQSNASLNGIKTLTSAANLTVTIDDQGKTHTLTAPTDSSIGQLSASVGDSFSSGTAYASTATSVIPVTITSTGTITFALNSDKTSKFDIVLNSGDTRAQVLSKINAHTSETGVTASLDGTYHLVLTSEIPDRNVQFTTDTAAFSNTLTGADYHINYASGANSGTTEGAVGNMIKYVAEARAQNGSDQSVLGYYSELAVSTKVNYESAISKITDVDVAAESTQLARWNTLVQAGTAMIAQANGSTQSALSLLK